MNESANEANPPRRKRRWLRRLLLALMVIVLGVVGYGLWAWRQWSQPPEFWVNERIVITDDEQYAEVEARAAAFEKRLTAQATEIHEPGEKWEMKLTQRELNEWLATRLQDWEKNGTLAKDVKLPDELNNPMVAIEDDRFIFAAEVDYEGVQQVVSLEFVPETQPDGSMKLKMDTLRGGRLALPSGPVMDKMVKQYGSVDAARAEAMAKVKQKMKEIELVIPVDKARHVRVVGVDFEGDQVVLTCETIQRKG